MENPSTSDYEKKKKSKLANKIRKAAAYRTEGSQPNTMGGKKLFQIIAQEHKTKTNKRKKSINTSDGAPSWDAMATVLGHSESMVLH